MRFSRSHLLWFVLYLVSIAAVTGMMVRARRGALRALATDEARLDWEDWRAAAERQQEGGGPVVRRAPRAGEPPELILLRDHFATSLLGVLLLTSAVFLTLVVLIRGVAAGPVFPVSEADVPEADVPEADED